jgi:DUF1680 family protein
MTKASGLTSVAVSKVTLGEGFWGTRVETNRAVTLSAEYKQLRETGRIDAWSLDWKNGEPNKPHYFWDSDVAKWIEAAAYSLATHPDAMLEGQLDAVIELIENAQQPDGYLNIYFSTVEPEKRWSNLRDWHELYCAGHLMEAAVAYYEAKGKRQLLDIMCRYADYIDEVFGPNKGQMRGYPGHQEIELALVKLFRATGEKRYLSLAQFFIDERGQQPHYFDLEAKRRGENLADYYHRTHEYTQSHLPVREQPRAVGHAVRACYMYAGMADVATETKDQTLIDACKRLWSNLTEKQMYITGGIGPSYHNEGFTFDYDLPNETAHAETCAAIALMFFAHRMLQLEPDALYGDVMEGALYNGVLSGVSLDGTQFFYANPLAAHPGVSPNHSGMRTLGADQHYRRSDWFNCACCPPNIARMLASLGRYIYSTGKNHIYVHLYVRSSAQLEVDGHSVRIEQRTDYPWKDKVRFTVQPDQTRRFTLALRLPGWCQNAELKVNAETLDIASTTTRGYFKIEREWSPGDQVDLTLPMRIERIRAHPRVRQNAGRVALQRGPLIYCLEEEDNGPNLANLFLPRDSQLVTEWEEKLLGGVVVITGEALRRDLQSWPGRLYQRVGPNGMKRFRFKAVPYCLWANREPGEMRVWVNEL